MENSSTQLALFNIPTTNEVYASLCIEAGITTEQAKKAGYSAFDLEYLLDEIESSSPQDELYLS